MNNTNSVDATDTNRIVNNYGRHKYRVLSDEEKQLVSDVKNATHDFGVLLDSLPPSREISLAITKLEEASMWAVRGLTA